MRFIYLFLLYLLVYPSLWANNRIDSILNKIEIAEGLDKIDIWNDWSQNSTKENILPLYEHFHKAYQDAEDVFGKDSALVWRYAREGSIVINLQAFGHGNLGIKLLDQMKHTADSISNENNIPHWTLGEWYYYLGYFNYKQVNMDKAEEYFLKALEISKNTNKKELQFRSLSILGLMKTYLKDYTEALYYFNQIDKIKNDASIPEDRKLKVFRNKAYLDALMGNYAEANVSYQMIIDSIHLFSNRYAFRVQTEYAKNLCDLGKTKQCLEYFEYIKPIFEKEGNDGTMLTFSERYSDALMKVGNFEKGTEWHKKARTYYYNIQEARRNDEVQEWQVKYEASEKEDTIKQLEQEKLINQFRLVIIALISLVGLGALSFFLYRNRIRQRQLAFQLDSNRIISENRDKLFSSITHDIRTPLALMLAPLERAEKNVNDKTAKSDIQMARRNGKRLMELFNQILDWNRAEAKTLSLNLQIGLPNLAFDSLKERYKQYAVEKGILFTHKIEVPEGQFLLDYDKLDRIISNLLENAIKFCDSGKGVHLDVNTQKEGNNYKLIAKISDQGPGILPEEKEGLFDRFVQGHEGRLKGGTGIGLALVKELVVLMKGDIQVFTEIGKGSEFKVTLPLELIDNNIATENGIEPNSNLNEENNEKPLILIVEDEPELLAFLKSALAINYQITIASSAIVGLNIAINRIPDAIISDWMLPDENGDWLCRKILENELTSHIPILILTAHNSKFYKKEALSAGAITWMQKPFELAILKTQLSSIIEQQNRLQQRWNNDTNLGLQNEKSENIKVFDNSFIQKINAIIEKHYTDEHFSVEKMAEYLLVSRVQLFRKVKASTGSSPSKLINEFRMKKARQILGESKFSVSEVCYQVGFSDPGYFGKVYKRYFKVTPSQDSNLH